MYRPKKYQKDEKEFILKFIEQHPFANFITRGNRLLATHIPVLKEENGEDWRLYSHIANHNEQRQFLKDGEEALIIFHGAHGYVSSSWYREQDISTWDYSAVHVNARIRLQDRKELEYSLGKLVERFESKQEKPLFYDELPRKMVEDHLDLITGFWLEPVKVEGIAKLHQAYDKDNLRRVVAKLDTGEPLERELSRDIRKENQIE
ncbi:FMN-binding negative transcriptional regulator [Gramella sp. BOM4]|nr:FMN-binding negative transcriptional regulator [Christiangramia bathymodioli]